MVFLGALLLLLLAHPAQGQLFFGSRPTPGFEIGPLFVRASIGPDLGPVTIDIYWGLEIPATRSALELQQDLYLLWPGEAGDLRAPGPPDPALARYLEARGFAPLAEGRLPLYALSLYHLGAERAPEALGGAPFVTYIRTDRAFGLSPPATWVRIPWTPRLANQAWLVDLRLRIADLIRPKKALWFEDLLRGSRHLVSIGYGDVQSRALFPLYLEHRDRQVRLGAAPAQLSIDFADEPHLKIDQVWPESSSRRLSESLEKTEVVSTFVDKAPGVAPHLLTVQFGYSSGLQAFTTVVIPLAFFALGNLAGPLLRSLALKASRALAAHVRPGASPRPLEVGQVLARETLARLVPGETTTDEVLRLCGPDTEHYEPVTGAGRRTLVYRGRRMVPHRQRTFWFLSTVSHWDFEEHTTRIEIEENRVRDVQAQIRRSRSPEPGTP